MDVEFSSMQIIATRHWAHSYSLTEKYLQLLALWDMEGDLRKYIKNNSVSFGIHG